jgi:hypothetical protein
MKTSMQKGVQHIPVVSNEWAYRSHKVQDYVNGGPESNNHIIWLTRL